MDGRRLLGVWAVAVALLCGSALPALAVEATEEAPSAEERPAPDINQIGTQNEVSQEFLPEEPEPPAFFRFFNVPLIAVGVLMVAALLGAYLLWQPRFAEERRSRKRRR